MATLDHRILFCAVWLAVHSDNQPAKHNILGLPLVAPGALGSDFLIHDLLARTQQKAYWIHVQANGVTKGQVDEGGKGMWDNTEQSPWSRDLGIPLWRDFNTGNWVKMIVKQSKTLLGCVVHFLQSSSPVFRCNQGPKAGGRES